MSDIKNTGRAFGLDETCPLFEDLPSRVTCPKCGKRTQIMSSKGGLVDGRLRVSRDLRGTMCGHNFSLNEVVQ